MLSVVIIGGLTVGLLVGLYMALRALGSIVLVARARQWPTANGIITDSSIQEIHGGENTVYKPVVTYQYSANNVSHTGTLIYPGADGTDKQTEGEQVLARYAIGTSVQVFYNPRRPQQAMLEHRVSNGTIVGFSLGLFIIGAVLAVIVAMIQM